MAANVKQPNETQRILAHVLANPMSTGREVAGHLDLAPTFVSEALYRLKRQGKLICIRGNNGLPQFWRGPEEDDERDSVPVCQRVVSKWKPHHHRDPLVAAIHGPAGI